MTCKATEQENADHERDLVKHERSYTIWGNGGKFEWLIRRWRSESLRVRA